MPSKTSARSKSHPIRRASSAVIDRLEERRLLSATIVSGSLKIGTGLWINITGTDANESFTINRLNATTFQVTESTSGFSTTRTGKLMGVRMVGGGGDDTVRADASVMAVNVRFHGLAGNDLFYGGTGNDFFEGGDGDDHAYAAAGNDTLLGGNGNDTLRGELGNDSINGDAGNDLIYAGDGNDRADGGADNDLLDGDAGLDTLLGNVGNDTLHGDDGNDLLDGSRGNDLIYGGAGNDGLTGGVALAVLGDDDHDTLYGDSGNDIISGLRGNDLLYGDDGNDTLDAGLGNDTVYGGADDDRALGDLGTDLMYGDFGFDLITYGTRATPVVINLNSSDSINGAAGELDTLYDFEAAEGGSSHDTITGNDQGNRLLGNAGHDTIHGLGGNDTLFGHAGNDSLVGGSDADRMYGGNDHDHLAGEAGEDFLDGQAGNDHLLGGDNRDTLIAIGGGALDSLTGGAGLDSFWLDSNVTETISDLSSEEASARAEHRVGSFVNNGRLAVSKELLGQNLTDPTSAGTKRNFKHLPLFSSAGPSRDDINQGQTGDCWYLATLSAVAGVNPEAIRQMVTDLGDGTYAVRFFSNNTPQYVRVDADLHTYTWSTTQLYNVSLGAENSTWAPLVEKALAWVRGSKLGTYATLNGGWMSEAFNRLGFTPTTHSRSTYSTPNALIAAVQADLAAGRAVTTGFLSVPAGSGLVASHAYTVDSLVNNGDGTFSVRLRNPWGTDGLSSIDGSNDGYVTISATTFFSAAVQTTSAVV